MKKKESLKELLKRLDEQSGELNAYQHEANRLFDASIHKMQKLLDKEKKEIQKTLAKIQSVLKKMKKKKD